MERVKKIVMMSIGYIALFTLITLVSSLIKGQPFKFDIWLDLFAGILCAVATEFTPKRKTGDN